jgi:nitroreductase/SAM-dependent methyltransferase
LTLIDPNETHEKNRKHPHFTEILYRLAERYSCRDFDGSSIDPMELEEIIADGLQAPSSCNQQNWHFIVVADPERKKHAREISGGNHHFEYCSALIYLCFQKGWTHGNFSIVQSVAGACYHMMLSAHLRGYQCIWNAGIGDQDELRSFLKVPKNFEIQGALAIGKAKNSAPVIKAPRRPVNEVFSWEHFDRPSNATYPVIPADDYPYFEITNNVNPFAEWDPGNWSLAQIADFRGYAVWAKSPLANVYVSNRQGEAQSVEHSLLPTIRDGRALEIMPWGGTSTTALCKILGNKCKLSVAELSTHNLTFIRERLLQEGIALDNVSFELMPDGRLLHKNRTIDLVVIPQILEHLPDPERLLDEVARVLKKDGHLVVSSRNMASQYGKLWRDKESKAQIPNQGPFTPIEACELKNWISSRFEIEEELGIGRYPTGDATPLLNDDALHGRLYAVRARLK